MKKNTHKQPLAAIGLGLLATATSANAQQRSVDTDVVAAPLTHSNTAHSNTANSKLEFQWGDFDADGLEDAVVIQTDRSLQLLRNLGDGSFENFTTQAGLDGVAGARFALWQDFDKDGLKDLFIGTESGPSHLLHNAGTIFVDVTLQSGITSEGFDTGAHWVDYDGDGVLDLHLIRRSTNTLYHGLASGGFEPIELPALYSENTSTTHVDSGDTFVSNRVDSADGAARDQREKSRTRTTISSGRNPLAASISPGTSTTSAAAAANNILACVQSLRDESGGSCIKASRDPIDGMLYPLGSDFFITAAGDVGIGTTTPESTFHIPTGDDAQAQDGVNLGEGRGFAMLGTAGLGELNLVMDNNEVMAREGPLASDLFLNKNGGNVHIGDFLTLGRFGTGGQLELNDHTGVRVTSNIDAFGGNFYLTDDTGVSNAFVADINANGGKMDLRNNQNIDQIKLSINSQGGIMALRNNQDVDQILLSSDSQGGVMVLRDPAGTSNLFVADIDANGGKMDLRSDQTTTQVRAAITPSGGYLQLFNNAGSERVVSAIDSADNGYLGLDGFNGNRSITMGGITGPNHASGFVQTWYGGFRLVENSYVSGSLQNGAIQVFSSGTSPITLANGIISGASKSFIQPHPTDSTQQIRYVSLEGPEHGVYFRGTADVINGIAQIEVPESFRLVASSEGLTVNVTPLGPTRGLYVSHKGLDYITIQEMPDGFGELSFDYQVMGVRSAFDELEPFETNVNFIAKPGSQVDVEGLPGNYGELMVQNGTLLPNGMPNEQTATLLGWTFDGEEWSHPTVLERQESPESSEAADPTSPNLDTTRGAESTPNVPTRTPATSQRKEIGTRTAVPTREANRRN
ncbi:MAG: hypothetical protein ACI8X5_003161 [Planctomycetota bacterium]|jgi:hypothetical protein